MNRDIIIGFIREHEEICLHDPLSRELKRRSGCAFCHHVNRDSLLLLTRLPEARKTVDVGMALSPDSTLEPYRPYEAAGFTFFHQDRASESQNISSILGCAFDLGYENVILMGHGMPNLPPSYIREAIHALRKHTDMVLGPLTNGSFYLIGMKQHVFATLRENGLLDELSFNNSRGRDKAIRDIVQQRPQCLVLPHWYAIRSLDDLRRLHSDAQGGQAWKARWTTCHVHDILLSEGLSS
jgi:glycosyltransferase A (GT-A) superfamily protein (DUF2064 family)